MCLHNHMRMRYPALQNAQLDVENDTHDLIPGLWRANANMHEVNTVMGPNRDTIAAKKQREYLRLYFNSPAGSVPWQDRMISVAFGLYCGILATSLQNSYFLFSLVHVYINIVLWLLHELLYMLLLVYPAKCLCDYKH